MPKTRIGTTERIEQAPSSTTGTRKASGMSRMGTECTEGLGRTGVGRGYDPRQDRAETKGGGMRRCDRTLGAGSWGPF